MAEESSSDESTFTDDEVTCPGFKGKLVGEETWIKCPYDKNHFYLSTKDSKHLMNCREAYLSKKRSEGQSLDIKVCRFMTAHHFYADDIEKHELECGSQHSLFNAMEYFIEKARYSNIREEMRKKRGEIAKKKEPEEKGLAEKKEKRKSEGI